MKNSTVFRVLLLGIIAIVGILGIQSYWILSTWNINEAEFNQKANLALFNVAKSLADVNGSDLPPRNIVTQRTSNYYVVNMEDVIDAKNLDYFIQKEFEALQLKIDFEYAVFDCSNDEMVYGRYHSYSPEKERNVELGDLPKEEDLTYYFGVKFPTRSSYLFDKMQLSLILMGILLITVTFFAYSMWVILRQKRLSDLQKDFINNMTHEFKTPLSTIKISADVFARAPEVQKNDRLARYASIMTEQSQRLNRQVEKVLQLANIDQKTLKLNPESVILTDLVQQIGDSLRVRVEELDGAVHIDIPEGEIIIRADRLHLTNILHNLLDNAVKYSDGPPQIDLQLKIHHQLCQLVVIDQGIGISREHQARIFDKFYRVPTGNVHNVKGFGLGLYYVAQICKAHHWKLYLESESGAGTTIRIDFPIMNFTPAGTFSTPKLQTHEG